MRSPGRLCLSALLLAIPVPAVAQDACVPFGVPQWNVEGSPRALAAGDLNGDGQADIVSTKDHTTEIALVLSTPDGSFAPALAIDVGDWPYSIALARLDANDSLDIIVGVRTDQRVAVLLNDGAGLFTPAPDLVLGTDVFHVAAGDVDNDQLDDIVITQLSTKIVSVYLSDGDGTFTLWGDATFLYGPYGAAFGDATGDGLLDLAIVEPNAPDPLGGSGVAYFYENLGFDQGLWQGLAIFPSTNSTSPFPQHVRFANVDGALGDEMIVACNQFSQNIGRVDVLSNPIGGIFQDSDSHIVGEAAPCLAVGLVNDDALPDIVAISHVNDDIVSVLMGIGGGSFAPAVHYDIPGNHLLQWIELADLDADGDLDPVFGGISGRAVSALINPGDGQFSIMPTTPTGNFPNTIRLADLDLDERADVLTFNGNAGGSVSVRLTNPDGTLGPETSYSVTPTWASMAIGPIDGDLWPDIAAAQGTTVVPLINDTFGGFAPGMASAPIPNVDNIKGIAAAHLDDDEFLDVAVTFFATSFPWRRMQVLHGDGMGGFALGADAALGTNGGVIRACNVDGDADIDLVVLRPYINDGITVFYNDGLGNFPSQMDYPVQASTGPVDLEMHDLDDDGDFDAVLTTAWVNARAITIMENEGGAFTMLPPMDVGVGLQGLDVGDVTGDGVPDIAVTINQGNTIDEQSMYGVYVFKGLGGLAFADPIAFAGSIGPYDVAIGDLNGDDEAELAVAVASLDLIEIHANVGCALDPVFCPGDADGSLIVNFADITTVLSNWGADYGPGIGPGDANADGLVTFADITAVLANWNTMCQ